VQVFGPDATSLGVLDLGRYGRPYAMDMRAGRLIVLVWPLVSSRLSTSLHPDEREREREREGTWWAHTGGGNALAFTQPT
jgi:hypothetical protein